MDFRQGLEALAPLYGIELSYHDIHGQRISASTDALIAMLGALGCEITSKADIEEAIDARHRARLTRALSPIQICWDGLFAVRLRARRDEAQERAAVELTLESGEQQRFDLALDSCSELDHRHHGGVHYVDLCLEPPTTLPEGYHQLVVSVGGREHRCALWAAPRRAYSNDDERGWGIFAPVYALRSERDAGIGDFEDLRSLARWVAEEGGSTVATLPMLPTFIEGPFDPSPYAPISRRFWNELYLAIDQLPELPQSPRAREMLQSTGFRRSLETLRSGQWVDYQAVFEQKRRTLRELSRVAFETPSLRAEIEKALESRPDIVDYARFRALLDRENRPFHQWPQALREGRLEGEAIPEETFRYHCYSQLRAEEQISKLSASSRDDGVSLYIDLPLGSHSDGYDAWRHRGELLAGTSVGAPPDALFEGGQDWGFAPQHPERSSAVGHAHWLACVRHAMRHAGILRIDHVMGLHRLYCIPHGIDRKEGLYVRGPYAELYAALSIESHRHKTYIVGEDLGTVPDAVREGMTEHGLGRLFVLQYEPTPAPGQRVDVPEGAVASVNTHDMPTFSGYWGGRDLQARLDLGHLDADEVQSSRESRVYERERLERWLEQAGLLQHPSSDRELLRAQLELLARSDARLVLASLDDLLGEVEPQNLPGTGPEHPNWRRKYRIRIEELEDAELHGFIAALQRTTGAPKEGAKLPRSLRSRPCAQLTDIDLHLFNEGTHLELHSKLGSRPGTLNGETGSFFAVWAPDAKQVRVAGDFNHWSGNDAPLWRRGNSGVWEGFVPGVHAGHLYKYNILSHSGEWLEKADPFARRGETPPRTASLVWDGEYQWSDEEWMRTRHTKNALSAPCSIYEVHLGSFARHEDGGLMTYTEIAPLLVEHVTRLGFTHVELLPVMEHPFYASWGYQVTGYYAPTSRYGSPEELMFLVDALHQAGIGVIFDWVPGHFPTDGHGLGRFDGTHLYEHADPRRGFHPDWRSYIPNYGRHEVRSFLLSSALYWLEHFHGDGLRVDGVASMLYLDYSREEGDWLPNEHGGRENLAAIDFLRRLNEVVYERLPDIQTIAEESTSWPMVSRPTYLGGLGFGMKWDMGWMHDTLSYFSRDPIHRKYHHDLLTFRGVYAWHENFVLPLSHDEVVHGKGSLLAKMPGDNWQRFANLRLLYGYMYATPGHKLLFMGSELASYQEWDHDTPLNLQLLDASMHEGIGRLVQALNQLYRNEPAFHELDQSPNGFAWVETENAEESVLAFERIAQDGSRILAVMNATPVPRMGYRVGVVREGYWREILNTDAAELGGSGLGNFGGVWSEPISHNERPCSIALTLPPLAIVYLRSP